LAAQGHAQAIYRGLQNHHRVIEGLAARNFYISVSRHGQPTLPVIGIEGHMQQAVP
jgi:hypothetical protein